MTGNRKTAVSVCYPAFPVPPHGAASYHSLHPCLLSSASPCSVSDFRQHAVQPSPGSPFSFRHHADRAGAGDFGHPLLRRFHTFSAGQSSFHAIDSHLSPTKREHPTSSLYVAPTPSRAPGAGCVLYVCNSRESTVSSPKDAVRGSAGRRGCAGGWRRICGTFPSR